MLAHFRSHAARLALALGQLALVNLLGITSPWIVGRLIDSIVNHNRTGAFSYAIALALIGVGVALLWVVNQKSLARLLEAVGLQMRREMHETLREVELGALLTCPDHKLRTHIDADIRTMSSSLQLVAIPAVSALANIVVLLILVALIDAWLAAAVVVTLIPLYFVQRISHARIARLTEETARADDRFAQSIATYLTYGGILRARAFGTHTTDERAFASIAENARDAHVALQSRTAAYIATILVSSALVTLALLFVGIDLVFGGKLSVGMLVTFLSYQLMVSSTLNMLARIPAQLEALRVADARLRSLRGLPRAPQGEKVPTPGSLRLTNVSFTYPDGRAGIRDVSFELRSGEKMAIIGPNGSGKSTLALIMQGLLSPQAGEVTLNGLPINECARDLLPEIFSYDSDELPFLTGTIAKNIGYAQVSTERAIEAASWAWVDSFAAELPLGYETALEKEGAGLSAGQLRRIGIARALAARGRIVVLDEPIDRLDPEAEREVLRRLLQLDRTLVVLTNRQESVVGFDRVITLDRGGISSRFTPATAGYRSPSLEIKGNGDRSAADTRSR